MEVVSASSDVATIARSSSRAARAFSLLGIEDSSNDARSLRDAASAAKIDLAELIALIERRSSVSHVVKPPPDAPLPLLTEYVVGRHHRRARMLLVDILDVPDETVPANADLSKLRLLVDRLAQDLVPHMVREELYLFPYIDMIDRPVASEQVVIVPLTGSVEYPLRSIRHDHSDDIALLSAIRECAARISAQAPAGDEVQQMLANVRELDRDLSEHIEFENNVLFPRALEVETMLMKKRQNS